MNTPATHVAHIVELDDGTRYLHRSRRDARACARVLLDGWRTEHPGERELGTWSVKRKSVGPRWLILLELREGAARRMWAAENRREKQQLPEIAQ